MCPVNETELSGELRTVHAFCSLTLAIVGTVGNVLSLILICKEKLYHASPVVMLILDLCVANTISTGVVMPFVVATSFQGRWIFGDVFCKIFGYVTFVALGSDGLIVTNLAFCHYLVIVHRVQLKSIIVNRHCYFRLFSLLGLPWIIAAIILLAPLTETWDTFDYDYRLGFCTMVNKQNGLGMHAAGSIILISVMTVMIFYGYPAILFVYVRSRGARSRSFSATSGNGIRTGRRKLHLMILVIIINYLITYLPYLITYIADPCIMTISLPVYTAIIYVSWSHTAINPFIYALLNTRIKVLWKRTFQSLWSSTTCKSSTSPHMYESGLSNMASADQSLAKNSVEM